jgi:plasmid maintenance system antidote protein VapI
LARYFGTSEEFWMNLQSNYELRLERRSLREKVAAITPLAAA